MNDEPNVLGIMKTFDIFERFRAALADEAASIVAPDDSSAALASVLRRTSNPNSPMMTARQRSMSLLDRVADIGYMTPTHLRNEFNAVEFYHQQQAKFGLVKALGRALVAIDNGATSIAFLMGHALPQGPLSKVANQRVAIAGPTALTAYLLARYVKELQYMPADQFARVLQQSNVTGQLFYLMSEERMTLGMDPTILVDATVRGFMVGHELALREPSLDEQSSGVQLRLSPVEVRQLAFDGRRSFTPFDLELEFQNGRHSHRPSDIDAIHDEGAIEGPQASIEAPRGDVPSISEQGTV